MAEGKQLSWGQGPERHKVATLDGTLFAKAGSITGGMAGNLAGQAQRWGDKEYETLKKVGCLDCFKNVVIACAEHLHIVCLIK